MNVARLLMVGLCGLSAGCAERHAAAPLPLLPLDAEAGAGSELPNLVADEAGGVFLSWVQPVGDGTHAMMFSAFEQREWGPARLIAQGSDWFVNWADFPSMAVMRDGTLAAHWLRKSGSAPYAYDVQIAFSRDDGATWSEPVVPHSDATATEHGFVSMLPWGQDRLFALWLDGRHFQGLSDEDAEKHAAMTLRYGILQSSGTVEVEGEVDARTCSCCQTAAIPVRDEVVVAYRDRSEAEIRDISVQRYAEGSWSGPTAIRDDGWHIDACPVNGPALDAIGEQVAIAWFTGARDEAQVQLMFSRDGGRTFGPAVRIDEGRPIGRVDVALMADGSGLVLWMEQAEAGPEIRLRRVSAEGHPVQHWTVAATSGDRGSGFPRMVLTPDRLMLAWTDIDANGVKAIKSGYAPIATLQAASEAGR